MKKIFLFASLTLSVVVSSLYGCRKDEKKEFDPNHKLVQSDCNNGIQDGMETGVDCGASCGECGPVDLTCNQALNSMTINGSYTNVTQDSMNNGHVFFYPGSGGTLYIYFGDYDPLPGYYQCIGPPFASGYAMIHFYPIGSGGILYESDATTGYIEVSVEDYLMNIKGCNLKVSKDDGLTYIDLDLNIFCHI